MKPNQQAVEVVAGIIWNGERNKILVAKRPQNKHKGGCWEFPGGKVETGESSSQALIRELDEELSLSFTHSSFYKSIDFTYPEKKVYIRFYHVFDVGLKIIPNEGQEIRWLPVSELKYYPFPEANEPIIRALEGMAP